MKVEAGPGYLAMMGQPHKAVFPAAAAEAIGRFLAVSRVKRTSPPNPHAAAVIIKNGAAKALERVYVFGSPTESSSESWRSPLPGRRGPNAASCF